MQKKKNPVIRITPLIILRTHGANKSIFFAEILDPQEVTMPEFALVKDTLFALMYIQGIRHYTSKN